MTSPRRPLDLLLALTSGVLVFSLLAVLAGYRAPDSDGLGDAQLAAASGTESLVRNPTHGLASASVTATYHINACNSFVEFRWDGQLVGAVNYNTSCNASLSRSRRPRTPTRLGPTRFPR